MVNARRQAAPGSDHIYVIIYVYMICSNDAMPQLNLYVDEATHLRMKRSAKSAGVSLSRWVTAMVRERTAEEWPADVLALAGAWQDFPEAEVLRAAQGKDVPRETI